MEESRTIVVNQKDLTIKEFLGNRVVTFKDIDDVHEKPEGSARKRFHDNRKRFIEGVDYFMATPATLENAKLSGKPTYGIEILSPHGMTLITETGYLMLVKAFTDDVSWEVQRKLVNGYFQTRQEPTQIRPASVPLNYDELAAFMVYNNQIIEQMKQNNEVLLQQQTAALTTIGNVVSAFCDFQRGSCSLLEEKVFNIAEAVEALKKEISDRKERDHNEDARYASPQRKRPGNYDWKKNAISEVKRRSSEKCRAFPKVLSAIYDLMEEAGYDKDALIEQYAFDNGVKKANVSYLDVIAQDEAMQSCFYESLEDVLSRSEIESEMPKFEFKKEQNKTKIEQKTPMSVLVRQTPAALTDKISVLVPFFNGSNTVFNMIYKRMEKEAGINVQDITDACAKALGYKRVSTSYAISKDEKLLNIFKATVDKMIAEKKVVVN